MTAARTSRALDALIADDEEGARGHLRGLLDACGVRVVAECATGAEVIPAAGRARPDFLCLDIRMPDIDGIEIARRLTAPDHRARPHPIIVFTTGYVDYALRAFEVEATDYLVKPLTAQRVEAAVRRVRLRLAPRAAGGGRTAPRHDAPAVPHLFVPEGDHRRAISPGAIRYVEARSRLCLLHADDGVHPVKTSVDRLECLLVPHGFLRTHRAYLVNLRRVRALVPWSRHVHTLLLDDGQETHVPVAKSRLAAFRQRVIWIDGARRGAGGSADGSGLEGKGGDRRGGEPGAGPGHR